ncbi:hypothetical protein F4561_002641 [Lipingzhangella halophila]|uniref:Uncharacterized protein n=1 Tax=Lipingzhangella halophila TaxID=1783352 RepID=A0A7W7RGZ4_9ACTN|nr:hypothetical protein [Lipingzhangella halophila]MBB4931821.1 hypothetical protein [Lipingzhangella halophila]
MKKIPTVFVRDFDNNPRHVTREVTPGCEWVLAGEGTPTRKWDGVCMKLDEHSQWWARREVKEDKTPPPGFVTEEHDDTTGKTAGWEPLEQSSFAKFHAEALNHGGYQQPGTYELVGPKINGNPEGFSAHLLHRHGWMLLDDRLDTETVPRDYDGLRDWLAARDWEGIVFHHPDGRMAKIKARDFPAA